MVRKNYPIGFNPENPLPDVGEDLLNSIFSHKMLFGDEPALELAFRHDAMNELRQYLDSEARKQWHCRYWMLIAQLNCENKMSFRKHLNYWWDWDRERFRKKTAKVADVSKFIPGEHYHVLDTKFSNLPKARKYLEYQGYEFGRLIEKHVYATDGD